MAHTRGIWEPADSTPVPVNLAVLGAPLYLCQLTILPKYSSMVSTQDRRPDLFLGFLTEIQ
jgi:hypothetical protein